MKAAQSAARDALTTAVIRQICERMSLAGSKFAAAWKVMRGLHGRQIRSGCCKAFTEAGELLDATTTNWPSSSTLGIRDFSAPTSRVSKDSVHRSAVIIFSEKRLGNKFRFNCCVYGSDHFRGPARAKVAYMIHFRGEATPIAYVLPKITNLVSSFHPSS